jgi:predicted permease
MLLQEIRYSFRLMARSPAFTAIAALSLALGIGANATIFSLADLLLFRPLPVHDPGEVVTLATESMGDPFDKGVSYPNYRDILGKSQVFDGLVAFQTSPFSYAKSNSGIPHVRAGMIVSGNFFKVLGVQPAIGRGFLPQEGEVPGRDAVVVLDYGFWNDQFDHDPSIVDKSLRINGIDFTIVGIAPKRFTGVDQSLRPAFYVPAMMSQRLSGGQENPLENRGNHSWEVKGRLKPRASQEQAQAEVTTIWKDLQRQFSEPNRNRAAVVETELQARAGQRPDAMLIPMFMVLGGLVLIIACANVANLLLARAKGRSREIALRLALGVSRVQLLRQLLTESLLLSLVGAAVGISFAYVGIRFIQTLPPPSDLSIGIYPELNYRVLVVCLLAALASTLFFGLAPAWQGAKTELAFTLKNTGSIIKPGRRTLGRNILVVGQIAFSMVLLVATGMLVDAFRKSLVLNPGFRTDHLMMMKFDTSLVRYNPEQTRNFYRNLVERAQTLPGVRSLALTNSVPFAAQDTRDVIPEGYLFPKGQETLSVMAGVVDEHYFGTMKTEIIQGRAFSTDDKDGSRRVAIVNEEFAKRYWPHEDAVGKRLQLSDGKGSWLEVVGIAQTGKHLFIAEPPSAFIYLPFAQNQTSGMILVAESSGDPASLATPLLDIVHALDLNQPIYDIRTFSNFYDQTAVRVPLMIIEIVATMGLLGFALALVGIYGLVSYSVARRTKEIGIRMAIGANRANVLKMVLGQGLILSTLGIIAGGLISVVVARLLAAGLTGLGAPNPATFVIVPLAVLLVTMAACYMPARRAALVNPTLALRYE